MFESGSSARNYLQELGLLGLYYRLFDICLSHTELSVGTVYSIDKPVFIEPLS